MGGIIIAIILIAALILTFSVLGIGGAFWDSVITTAEEKLKRQNDDNTATNDPDVSTTGTFAKDTGTRVCNLNIKFVGTVDGNLLSDDINLFHGDYQYTVNSDVWVQLNSEIDQITGTTGNEFFNTNVVEYLWVCTDDNKTDLANASWIDLALFNWSARIGNPAISDLGVTKLSLEEITGGEKTVRYNFYAEKLDDRSKRLSAKTLESSTEVKTDFQARQILADGTKLPANYNVNQWLYDVTEYDYMLTFWSDEWLVNDKRVNQEFQYKICRPSGCQ